MHNREQVVLVELEQPIERDSKVKSCLGNEKKLILTLILHLRYGMGLLHGTS